MSKHSTPALASTPTNHEQWTSTPTPKQFTPANNTRTVIFIRDENDTERNGFVPICHGTSLTLKDLAEEYNISSVLECDSSGRVPPRAVAYDSPSDVLHNGQHYIARRDAKMDNNQVTFKGKILVQEYELQTPESSKVMFSSDGSHSAGLGAPKHMPAMATPAVSRKRSRETEEEDETDLENKASTDVEATGYGWNEDAGEGKEELNSQRVGNSNTMETEKENDNNGPQNTNHIKANHSVLTDATNTAAPRSSASLKRHNTSDTGSEVSNLNRSYASNTSSNGNGNTSQDMSSITYVPFTADIHGDGQNTLVTLEALQNMCLGWESEQQENEVRHKEALQILETTRRALFQNP